MHLAAAAAKGARLFHATDPAYTRTLLGAARTAYDAARRHPHLIAPDDHARFGGGPYADDELEDDFYWAAVELWLTTDEEIYRQEVLSSALHSADAFDPAGFDFDRVTAPGRLDLALAGRHLADHDRVVDSVRWAPTDCWSCSAGSPGVSLTRRLRGGTGDPTAGSSTTSWCSRWRSW